MAQRWIRRSVILAVAASLVLGVAPPALAQPANDNFQDATQVTGIPYSDGVSTTQATNEPGEPQPCVGIAKTVWYRFTPATSAVYAANTFGSDFDTALAVYTGSDLGSLQEVGCNDDHQSFQSKVTFNGTAGVTYHIQAGGYFGSAGNLVLNLDESGGIAGTVTDEAMDPLAGICVSAWNQIDEYWGYWDVVASTQTDADGNYALGVDPGVYRVEFRDCFNETYVAEFYDDAPDFETATNIHVSSGVFDGIDAVLTLGGTITGTVTDLDGAPLRDICVQAFGETVFTPHAMGWTDGAGTYEIKGLRQDSYKVRFNRCSYYESASTAEVSSTELTLVGQPNDNDYEIEWWDDKPDMDLADLVPVTSGQLVEGIDAALGIRLRPDVAVTSLVVKNVPLQTDAASVPGPGTSRTVEVTIDNLGTKDANAVFIRVEVCPATLLYCEQLFQGGRRVRVGQQINLDLDWNSTGSFGDMTVRAVARTYDDGDRSNDVASVRHYSMVGGTGVGVGCTNVPSFFVRINTCPL